MNHERITSTALAAASAAAVLGAGLVQTPALAATKAAPKYVVLSCAGKPVTHPARWTPYCADYGVYFSGMHWTGWNSHAATGYGTVSENDNYPNHARGRIYTVPVLLTLWGSTAVRKHPGDRAYTEMTMIFPGRRPAVYELVKGKWTASYPATQTLRV